MATLPAGVTLTPQRVADGKLICNLTITKAAWFQFLVSALVNEIRSGRLVASVKLCGRVFPITWLLFPYFLVLLTRTKVKL